MSALIFALLGYLLIAIPGLAEHALGLAVSLLILFVLFALWTVSVLYRHISPLAGLLEMIKDLSQGHAWRRFDPQQTMGITAALTKEVNLLAEKMQKLREYQHVQHDRLEAVIKHMASGLLFINEQGKIVLSNDKLRTLLGWTESHQGLLYYLAPLPEAVIEMIQATFSNEREEQQEVFVDVGVRRNALSVLVAPVLDPEGKNRGVVIVFHDITKLKKLEQVRQDFVANVSHELKTPITSIKGFTETLLDGAMYQEEHLKHFLTIIGTEAERLHRLVEELLQLSQIEQGRMSYQWKAVDLSRVVENSLSVVKGKAEDKNIVLTFQRPESSVQVEADEDRLQQIVINLLMNAIQYTPERGKIMAWIEPWEQGYGICIQDTGIGIPKDQIPRIFERFYRVDRARSRASGGTGLGLAIVKHLVEAHHGEIRVESEPGKGSTFCVFFPEKQPHSPRETKEVR
jgi:two-component system phosphate regulon sensor histidine kinase PhoR